MAYRRLRTSEIWHWCRNCSHWPSANYETSHSDPDRGRLCRECRTKKEKDTCEASPRGTPIT